MRFHSNRRISILSALAAVLIAGDVAQAQVVEPPGNYFRWVGHDNIYDGVFATSSWIVDEGPGGVPGPSDAAYFTVMEAYTILCANELTWGTVIEGSGVTFSGAYNTGLVNVGGSGAIVIPPETKFKAENVVVGVDSGTGSIEVNGQLEVSSVKMTIGATDAGSVDVKGPEGFYIADEAPTFVGYDSGGFFRVEHGGHVRLRYAAGQEAAVVAGDNQGAFGFMQVVGDASRWESDAMTIGRGGEGVFEVAGGAQAIVEGATGNSAILVGSLVNSNGDLRVQQEGSLLTIPHGGIEIGRRGLGEAEVMTGGSINIAGNAGSASLLLGTVNPSNGSLMVSGAGSKIDIGAGALEIGREGIGRVDVLAGGQITIQHDANSPAVVVGTSTGGTGRLEVSGENSKLIAHGPVELGRAGEATFVVQNKGTAEVQKLLVGSTATVPSRAFIDGPGSSLKVEQGSIEVGVAGKGMLDLLNKGLLVSQTGSVGIGGEGAVTITGADSEWKVFERLTIGDTSRGTLSLVGGGALFATEIVLGGQPGSEGSLYIDGAESRLNNSLPLQSIGGLGHGSLIIRNQAQIHREEMICGSEAGSSGSIFVDDFGSSLKLNLLGLGWEGSGFLTVRGGGRADIDLLAMPKGRVEVRNDGEATMRSIHVAKDPGNNAEILVTGGSAKLNVTNEIELGGGGAASLTVLDGGEATARSISTHNANIHIAGNASGFSELNATAISMSANSTLDVWQNGILRVSSALVLSDTIPTIINGRIDVGAIPAGAPHAAFRVGPGGFVSSNGSIPFIHNMGGVVHPGNSPGALTITGDYIQDSGVLQFSIAGTQAGNSYSQLVVNGNVQLQGAIELVFEDGFAPLQGQTFDLLDIDGDANQLTPEIRISNLAPGFLYDFAATVDGYRLTALNDGVYTGPPPGDFDLDGDVDGRDFLAWQRGVSPNPLSAGDLADWQENYGTGQLVAVNVAVPEPTTLILLMLATAGGWVGRRTN